MVTREKYDCQGCGRRIEKEWHKTEKVPVRIFEECGGCNGQLATYMLIDSLYGVSQPPPHIEEVKYEILEGLCDECLEDEGNYWGLCGSCYWRRELTKDGTYSTWDKDIPEEDTDGLR